MADLLGRRRVFLAGVALFGLASLACGLAQQPWQLVAGRFVQGAGAAMASPAALSLITLLFPGTQERARALGIWGAIAALGATSGLMISGVLTDLTSWRWIFLINLPVAAVAIALLPRLVAESRASRRARLGAPGAVLGTAAVVSLVYGLLQAGEAGWADAAVLGPLLRDSPGSGGIRAGAVPRVGEGRPRVASEKEFQENRGLIHERISTIRRVEFIDAEKGAMIDTCDTHGAPYVQDCYSLSEDQ